MPRIPAEVIDRIKQATDLVAVIKDRGVRLRKTGQVYKGRCPFHEEKTPSFTVTPAEKLWHCFGCDVGGDVIRFVELMDNDSRTLFKALGVLTDKGRELLHDCVVFPLFDDQGNVVNLYGRRLVDGEVNHLYLPGPKAGLWNYQVAKRSKSLLLTESVIDALTLIDRGLHDVMPCYGVHGLTDELLAHLEKCDVNEVTLCFDGDDAGKRGMEKVSAQLKEKNIIVHAIELPDGEDVNSFLNRHPIEAFQALLNDANPDSTHKTEAEKSEAANAPRYEKTDHGFTLARRHSSIEQRKHQRQRAQYRNAQYGCRDFADRRCAGDIESLLLWHQRDCECHGGFKLVSDGAR
jgi:DNA primase